MRIKANNTFIHESQVVHAGTEIDVPEHVGIYLIGEKAAVKVDGGKGVKDEVTIDPIKVDAQVVKAINGLKPRTKLKD